MKLVKPTKKYEKSWQAALAEFEAEERKGFWNVPDKPTDLNEYIKRTNNHSKGIDLPDYWVPATTYWLIDKDQFVGHVNIRHELNEKLQKIGGHIGFAIRPSCRQEGYGTKVLELAIPKAQKIGLAKALVTCDDDNVASARIIEKNGGKLDQKLKFEGKLIRHYWIDLRKKANNT